MGLIIGYLNLVSLHFFHPITLTYVMSCVLRPPWGHEIRCYLWQPLLRLVFGIWLIYGRHPISSFGRCSLMLGGDLVMDVDDWFILWMIFDVVWLPILLCISYHTRTYSFFHLVEMSPYFELGHFHRSKIPNGVCWDDISSSGALLSSLTVFMILGSIYGVFLRWTSGLLLSWG